MAPTSSTNALRVLRGRVRDFKVLIFDNASTDGTSSCQAWAAHDARFCYVRQPRNVGAMANFRDALLAADTPWFMWRADDDLSADNYLEALYRLATETPACKLAVSTSILAILTVVDKGVAATGCSSLCYSARSVEYAVGLSRGMVLWALGHRCGASPACLSWPITPLRMRASIWPCTDRSWTGL